MRNRLAALAAFTLVLALPSASLAGGEEPTREQWSKQADSICKQKASQQKKWFAQSLELSEAQKFGKAGKLFVKVFRHELADARSIDGLTPPPADASKIARYVKGVKRSSELAIKSGKALGNEDLSASERLFGRSIQINTKAEKSVRGFKIDHCIGLGGGS